MNVVFRTDASTTLGSGHVMRCLTLAEVLRNHGATVSFVCCILEGHMHDAIAARGFAVLSLSGDSGWQGDAAHTQAAIQRTRAAPNWLVVDHYALDSRWEIALRNYADRIMVIDDLADRPHDCDLLLDQNFDSPLHARYARLMPSTARSLLGTQYALVRPEFALERPRALARRKGELRRVLVTMGSTDPANDTATALVGLAMCPADGIACDVVIGAGNPHRQAIRSLCDAMPWAELHIQTAHMAELMTRADLAITAGGSTTWERCTLGLPAIVTIQSADQAPIAAAVQQVGAHRVLGSSKDVAAQNYGRALQELSAQELVQMSEAAAALCDGRGAERVASHLIDWIH
jgi:UDP-2,4-diacetamido-2,4,6-trideoxy-beta-L-altropyranose hydrolase